MLYTNNLIIKYKAVLLNLAEEGGIDALVNQSRRVPNLKNRGD